MCVIDIGQKLPDQQSVYGEYSTIFCLASFAFISSSFFFLKVHFEFANSFAIFGNVSVLSSIFFFCLLIFSPFFVPYFLLCALSTFRRRRCHVTPTPIPPASRAPCSSVCLALYFGLFCFVSFPPFLPLFFAFQFAVAVIVVVVLSSGFLPLWADIINWFGEQHFPCGKLKCVFW